MDFNKREIANGITLIGVSTNRFKTNEIAITLALPLKKETASVNALLIHLLSRKCRQYDTMSKLNKRLAYLYGATLTAHVTKLGECQQLRLGITCLDDRFSLNGESISFECVKLLTALIYNPRLDDSGMFFEADIDAEKRILTEKIEAENNEKRTYVLRQTEALMFEDEPYGINRYGTIEDIEAITPKDCIDAYNNMVNTAKIMITIVGNTSIDAAKQYISSSIPLKKRNYKPVEKAVFVPKSTGIKQRLERLDVKQGKLVMGYRVNLDPSDKLTAAMRSFCDIFGGGPYSKLFANVREKLSLCYYCCAKYTRLKSCIMIQSGCNEENMDKAIAEIKNQLEAIQKGDFDDELAASKAAVRDAILSVNDTPELIEVWYTNQIIDDEIKTPEQSAEENDRVTGEDIIKCSKLLSLDTVYKLSDLKEDKQ